MINSDSFDDIYALVLAAGKSQRMGRPKMVLPFGSQTIIEKVIDNIIEAGISDILVVTGSDRDAVESACSSKPVVICYNPLYEEGMHSSVVCGFSHLPGNARAAMLFLGDQPFIPAEVIQSVILTWKQTRKGIVIPTYRGKRGHPTLFDFRLREEILHLDPVSGLRSVTMKFPEEILEVELNFPQILRDIDTKIDYLNELNQMI
jgi:molybdenum cofactor cytidylyltransferase